MATKREILKPKAERQAHYRVPEHEVLLSFVNDADAELFHEWWENAGWFDFRRWAEKQEPAA